ncbi:MAG: permease-like cell division protein FtsX [Patescibacteria group bacterium]
MFWVKTRRVIRSGFINFWRNGWVSLITVLIMTITLFIMGSLIFAKAVLDSTLSQIQDKVDVSVYFKNTAEESDIIALKTKIEKFNEVKNMEYISREKALENFKERHKDNALILQSLEELGTNPLGAVLNIKARQTSQYESIAKFLDDYSNSSNNSSSIIDKVNYYQNKVVIEKLSKIIDSTNRLGVSVSILFFFLSFIVTFNTIRLAIYSAREEIGIMRLVGASNRFISGPFVIEGVMYGTIASIIAIILFYPFSLWLGPMTESFLGGINLYTYYLKNFFQVFFVLFVTGIALGVFSSMIAVRRYLKV